MKGTPTQIFHWRHHCLALTCAVAVALLAGCNKKKPETAAAPESASATDTSSNATDTAAPAAEAPQKPLDLTPVQTAIKTGDYDKAAADLLALQRLSAQMSPQQQTLVLNQMHSFQRTLAAAVGSGDPKALAAAQRLRESAMHH